MTNPGFDPWRNMKRKARENSNRLRTPAAIRVGKEAIRAGLLDPLTGKPKLETLDAMLQAEQMYGYDYSQEIEAKLREREESGENKRDA